LKKSLSFCDIFDFNKNSFPHRREVERKFLAKGKSVENVMITRPDYRYSKRCRQNSTDKKLIIYTRQRIGDELWYINNFFGKKTASICKRGSNQKFLKE
jgi:RNA polymerase-interacting CarD/CdnL/TRCF family regulator